MKTKGQLIKPANLKAYLANIGGETYLKIEDSNNRQDVAFLMDESINFGDVDEIEVELLIKK